MWIASASSSSRCVSVARRVRAHATASARGHGSSSSSRASDGGGRLRGLAPVGVERSSGFAGSSYGSETPVKSLDLAGERLRVEALRVALGAHLERRRDVDLDERRVLLDERARAAARLLVRRDRARRRRRRRRARGARRPSRCARCSCRGPPSRTRGPSRDACARCRRRGCSTTRPRCLELALDERADRRLAGGREAREPEHEAAHDVSSTAPRLVGAHRVDAALDLVGAGPAARAALARLRRVRVADRVVARGRAAGCTAARARGCSPSTRRRVQSASGFAFQSSCCSSQPSFGASARVGDWSRRMPVIQASRPPSAVDERRDLRDREVEVGLRAPRASPSTPRAPPATGLRRPRSSCRSAARPRASTRTSRGRDGACRSRRRAPSARARTACRGGSSPPSGTSTRARPCPGTARARTRGSRSGVQRLDVSAGAGSLPRSTSFNVSPRRPSRSVSSGITSSGGMLPRLTDGPNCLMNQACAAFDGASKIDVLGADRVGDLADQLGAHAAGRVEDARGAALARLGDHLPRAGVELLAQPLRPLGRRVYSTLESFEPTSERTVKSRAKSAISSSLRSRGMSTVPSEISTCVKPSVVEPRLVLVELVLARRRPRRTCRRSRRASPSARRACARGCCVTQRVPQPSLTIEMCSPPISRTSSQPRGPRPLSITCVSPPWCRAAQRRAKSSFSFSWAAAWTSW